MIISAPTPRPDLRERMSTEGAVGLGDADLVALLLGTGTKLEPVSVLAARVLTAAGGVAGLYRTGISGIPEIVLGLGAAKRARLDAAFELGRRGASRVALDRATTIGGPEALAEWARVRLGPLTHEELWLVAIDTGSRITGARQVARGGTTGCSTSVRDILRLALQLGGASFMLVHNHPSGNPTPSMEDITMSRTLARAGLIVAMPLLDHVIVAPSCHVSLFDNGLLEES